MILTVACELSSPRDTARLCAVIELFGPSLQFMKTTWLISTPKSPQELAKTLQIHFDPEDFIAELTSNSPPHLPKRASNWVANQRRLDRERLSNVFLIDKTPRHIESAEVVSLLSFRKNTPPPLAVRRGVTFTEPYKPDAPRLPSRTIYIAVLNFCPTGTSPRCRPQSSRLVPRFVFFQRFA